MHLIKTAILLKTIMYIVYIKYHNQLKTILDKTLIGSKISDILYQTHVSFIGKINHHINPPIPPTKKTNKHQTNKQTNT